MKAKFFTLLCLTVTCKFSLASDISEQNIKTSSLELVSQFERYLNTRVASKLPGFSAGVIIDGEVVYKQGFGLRELGKDELINEDTVFRLASVSKTLVPSAVARLVSQNKLTWHEPISKVLPELKLSKVAYQNQINLSHLVSNRSGLQAHAYTNLIQDDVPYAKILKQLHKVNFTCRPGTCYGYQNVVYSLSGDIIAKASGQSYEDYVNKALFEPLNMDRSSFGLANFMAEENRATPHRWNKQKKQWQVSQAKRNYYRISPAAGANASLNDMLKFVQAQLGSSPSVLDRSALKFIHKPVVKTSRKLAHYKRKSWDGVKKPHYAHGWRTFDFKKLNGFVHHGGWVAGVRTEVVFNPDLALAMVFLTNSEPGIASDVVPDFINMYIDAF